MPNIVAELMQEISRVAGILENEKLKDDPQRFAANALRSALMHLAMNSYEGMREALEDLREIGRQK
jgi:hypothetical protein